MRFLMTSSDKLNQDKFGNIHQTNLNKLKQAKTLHDLALLLGFKPQSLSYILYKLPADKKYYSFEIPKKSGGMRVISAPTSELKILQKRLANLLQDCISIINKEKQIKRTLSHGFRRKYSIITNANEHTKKRYVLNIDLENFFGVIDFGRVRGFFIKNRNFNLDPKIATIIAQIACYNNHLPQGSPCSPVISNLIGHPLDISLANLAKKTGCRYSRYADDLTFSTNKKDFPRELAVLASDLNNIWNIGKELNEIISKNRFSINSKKTRMQYKESRQDVTGLIVNDKVNIRSEYWRTVRAMTNALFKTGDFYIKTFETDKNGNVIEVKTKGNIEQLNGMFTFINSIDSFNKQKNKKQKTKPKEINDAILNSRELYYKRFLFFKEFYSPTLPLIICEGKTDNIYIKYALLSLSTKFPQLIENKKIKIKFFKYTPTFEFFFPSKGGVGDLKNFIAGDKKKSIPSYAENFEYYKATPTKNPVIILIDNDEGANDIFALIKNMKKSSEQINGSHNFYYISKNLYVVAIPKINNKETMIEDYFDEETLNTKINRKKFSRKNTYDKNYEYGKAWFAEQVIKPNWSHINFERFELILKRIELVLSHYRKISKEPYGETVN